MARGGLGVEVDTTFFDRFARKFPDEAEQAVQSYFQKGGVIVRGFQVDEALARFGREQAESGMKTYDPGRPTGFWAGSISTQIGKREARIGPTAPYSSWVEDGLKARRSGGGTFRGHHPVRRATEHFEPLAGRLLYQEIEAARNRST
jgi:hypothetical protein